MSGDKRLATILVDRGLARRRHTPFVEPSVYYHVTPAGRAALDHDVALAAGDQG